MTPNGMRIISVEIDVTDLTTATAYNVADLPAQSVVLGAGLEVLTAVAGSTAFTANLGTGLDVDEFVAAFNIQTATAGAVAPSLPGVAYVGSADTLDLVPTITGTATAGKLRVWALIADVDGKPAATAARDNA